MPAPRRSVRINKKFKIDPDTAVVSSTESRVSDDDFQEQVVQLAPSPESWLILCMSTIP